MRAVTVVIQIRTYRQGPLLWVEGAVRTVLDFAPRKTGLKILGEVYPPSVVLTTPRVTKVLI